MALRRRLKNARKTIRDRVFFRAAKVRKEIVQKLGAMREKLPSTIRPYDRSRKNDAIAELERQLEVFPLVEQYRWHALVLTVPYQKDETEAMTPQSLRGRARILTKAIRVLWHSLFARDQQGCAGLFWILELGDEGNAHLHAAYFGRPLSPKRVERVVRRKCPSIGRVWFEPVKAEKGGERALLLYHAKNSVWLTKEWQAGKASLVLNPSSAASWECALVGMHDRGWLGSMRSPSTRRAKTEPRAPLEPEPAVFRR